MKNTFPIFHRPFSAAPSSRITSLQAIPETGAEYRADGKASARENAAEVIVEREGVPFINAQALPPEELARQKLNSDFKTLVDSITAYAD
jgi:hypothetical protein